MRNHRRPSLPRRAFLSASVALWLSALLAVACGTPGEPFRGTELTSGAQAAPFELRDQHNRRVGLPDLSGRVVVTFLYTSCPDVCPITTSQLRQAHADLGDDADQVAMVAISVDPARDTVEAAARFYERWEMADRRSYLVGSEAELRPVWDAYYVDPVALLEREDGHEDHEHGSHGNAKDATYLVTHSAPVYLVDRDGVMRVVFTLPFDTNDLVHDILMLAG